MSVSEGAKKRPGLCPAYCLTCKAEFCARGINHDRALVHDCGRH